MGIKHTRNETVKKIVKATKDMDSFYAQNFVKWSGKTKDTNEYHSEIIASWLLENPNYLHEIKKITRSSSYFRDNHDAKSKNNISNRNEEKIAMKIFIQKSLPEIGNILDYQIPLKDTNKDVSGKIDLLSYDDKTSTFRILELKKPENEKDTLLRCVLEAYTYKQVLDSKKLTTDTQKKFPEISISDATSFKACVLLFEDCLAYREYNELKSGNRPALRKLMKSLDIEFIQLVQTYSAKILEY